MSQLVDVARELATRAHEGQVDKAGAPYISHPRRVAELLRELHPNATDSAVAAAWLHDVLDDTDLTPVDLALAGVPADVIRAVRALTRRPGVTPQQYYRTIRRIPLARAVKHADITDNLDTARLALLDDVTTARLRGKYERALNQLGLPIPTPMRAGTP